MLHCYAHRFTPLRSGRRGGATFTMILFVLLLVSSGLMYFYFQRCRSLERELAKWQSGDKSTAVTVQKDAEKPTLGSIATSMRDRLIGISSNIAPKKAAEQPEDDESEKEPASETMPAPERVTKPRIVQAPRQETVKAAEVAVAEAETSEETSTEFTQEGPQASQVESAIALPERHARGGGNRATSAQGPARESREREQSESVSRESESATSERSQTSRSSREGSSSSPSARSARQPIRSMYDMPTEIRGGSRQQSFADDRDAAVDSY